MSLVRAIYEGGVFRPLTPPELPEGTEVEFELHVAPKGDIPPLSGVYDILSLRFSSGEHDVAARHNEHQP